VTALDQFNNVATSYTGTEHFTTTDGGAGVVLPANYTFVAGDNGAHTFTNGVTLVTSGPQTITATDTSNGTINGTTSINVTTTTPATITAISVQWGTMGTSDLHTAADGLRLLATGRSTDLDWMGINRLTITLSQAATLSSGDITIAGMKIANYGVGSISGGGTVYTINFGQAINAADRVTVTIGNAGITTYTRRLDVLPGDFNDDGFVTSSDMVLVSNARSAAYNIFGDLNGDGVVDITDVQIVRNKAATTLP
jgi:hypothetical protein